MSGMLLSAAWLFLRGGERIREWRSLPWYMLGAGLFGLILYQTISVTLPRLGGTTTVMLIIIGQLLVGILVDHFGWLGVTVHPASPARLLGVLVLLLGIPDRPVVFLPVIMKYKKLVRVSLPPGPTFHSWG
jgi:transporter family-2 protein